ncbi:transcriptional regulator with XRE-family HTH domain [Paraburkholderia sp. GAS199]|uniref:helix-turn-helix domain-containing protein n=1 Tax=Paraburkholderia sp. GAS199 TaxID=3035126 RepID=UPI003D233B13
MIQRLPVGKVIRTMRRERDLTQAEFASRCGITGQYLSLLELGQVNVSLDTLQNIAAALEQPVSALLLQAEVLAAGEPSKRPRRKA